jgi:hypothetical protein
MLSDEIIFILDIYPNKEALNKPTLYDVCYTISLFAKAILGFD